MTAPVVGDALPEITVVTDPVRLFGYSALTWNPHRIHYDAPYTVDEEGYPGLVVQGPFLAGLLLRCAREWAAGRGRITRATSRSSVPVYCGDTVVCGGRVTAVDGDEVEVGMSLRRADGVVAAEGTVHVHIA